MTLWEFAVIAAGCFAFWTYRSHQKGFADRTVWWVMQGLLAFIVGGIAWLLVSSYPVWEATCIFVGFPCFFWVMAKLDWWQNPPPTQAEIEEREKAQLKKLQERYPNV